MGMRIQGTEAKLGGQQLFLRPSGARRRERPSENTFSSERLRMGMGAHLRAAWRHTIFFAMAESWTPPFHFDTLFNAPKTRGATFEGQASLRKSPGPRGRNDYLRPCSTSSGCLESFQCHLKSWRRNKDRERPQNNCPRKCKELKRVCDRSWKKKNLTGPRPHVYFENSLQAGCSLPGSRFGFQ